MLQLITCRFFKNILQRPYFKNRQLMQRLKTFLESNEDIKLRRNVHGRQKEKN